MPTSTITISGSILRPGWRDRLMASVQRSVEEELRVIQRDAEALARPHADTGNYAGSFFSRVRRTNMRVEGVMANSSQSATWHGIPNIVQHVIETGRIPGGKMPPKGVLLPWMARHGIPASAEFLVRRKIARDGTPARHIFRRTFDRAERRFGPFKIRLRNQLIRDLQR